MNVYLESLNLHRRVKGKLGVFSKVSVKNRHDLSLAYTPGVAEPCRKIFSRPSFVFDLTLKNNSLAVVSDGSSVLGLGNIGAHAAIPVMEGKAVLFKELAGIDAFPVCVQSQKVSDIVRTVMDISPVFGAVNLEDISAPRCFDVEEKLQELGIPVMHDDQHGTAVTVLAGLVNACKVAGKSFEDLKVVVSGAGAAGTAIAKILVCEGLFGKNCTSVKDLLVVDSSGVIFRGRKGLFGHKKKLSLITNRGNVKGGLADAIHGADAFVGVSHANVVSKKMVSLMAKKSIVFALANPVPEIMPKDALKAGAFVAASGRSDMPNQINNVYAFPGIFRGALDAKATVINAEMKLAAAHALAACVKPSRTKILPSLFDKKTVKGIALGVKKAAMRTGVVRN